MRGPLGVALTGWYVGYVLASVVIAIVVILVAMILALARRIGVQADQITTAIDEARVNTLQLWETDRINRSIRAITQRAQEARMMLGGGQ